MTRFPNLPLGMKLLARDPKGFPVPWFVDRKAPPHDGGPDFRVMDGKRWALAVRERRCWVCGLRLGHETGTFVAGPMCGVNRTSAEPPCHLECARASVKSCPFLSHPGRIRDDRGLPADARSVGGMAIKRNPGVTMLWTSGYEVWRPPTGGKLIAMSEPEAVEVPEAAVEPDTHFAHDLGGDDLDRIELMFEIEAAWDIEIPDDDAEQLRTVADVVRYLAGRLSAVEAA